MNFFPFSVLHLFLTIGVFLCFVEPAQPTELFNPLSLKDQIIRKFPQMGLNPNYPNYFQKSSELCFVIAKIAFKSMSEFNERLDIKDLRNYNGCYLGNNDHIGNESYEELLRKDILFDCRRDVLCNVLKNLTFSELLYLDLEKCSVELALIVRIIEFLAQCDNGVGYLIFKIYRMGDKVDLGLLARVVVCGQVMCDEHFLKTINTFGQLSVENWQNIVLEDSSKKGNRGFLALGMNNDFVSLSVEQEPKTRSSTVKHLITMARMKDFTIRNEEKKYWCLVSGVPLSIFLIRGLFAFLRKEIETLIMHRSHHYWIQDGAILSQLPSEFIYMIMNSIKSDDLILTPSLKTMFLNLCPGDQKLFESNILSRNISITRENLYSSNPEMSHKIIESENFRLVNLFSNRQFENYQIKISNDRIYFHFTSLLNRSEIVKFVLMRKQV